MTTSSYLWVVLAGIIASSSTVLSQQCTPAQEICPNVNAVSRGSIPDILGVWFLYASTPVALSSEEECSLFRTEYPCACIGGIIKGIVGENSVRLGMFGQNQNNREFRTNMKHFRADLLETCNSSAVYNVVSVDHTDNSLQFKVARIGTDDGQSYLIYYICSDNIKGSNNSPIVWFFSRTPIATDSAVSAVKGILAENNIDYSILKNVDQTNCPYKEPIHFTKHENH